MCWSFWWPRRKDENMTDRLPHRKLNAEMVAKVRELAALGLRLESIAAAVSVSYGGLKAWLKNAREGVGTDLEADLLAALHEGRQAGEQALVAKLLASQDTADARWLLSHSSAWRTGWSDNSAVTREVNRAMGQVVSAIESAGLRADQRQDLLLRLAAAGIIAAPEHAE